VGISANRREPWHCALLSEIQTRSRRMLSAAPYCVRKFPMQIFDSDLKMSQREQLVCPFDVWRKISKLDCIIIFHWVPKLVDYCIKFFYQDLLYRKENWLGRHISTT
jgi:hypothetical protein